MNFDSLELYKIIYQEKSASRAAQKAFMTPQGVNRVLRAIEAEMGSPLFERTASGLVSTASGDRFYDFVVHVTREFEWLKQSIESSTGRESTIVRIGFEPDLLSSTSLELFDRFSEIHPEIKLEFEEMSEEFVEEKLGAGAIDVAFVVLPYDAADCEAIPLKTERVYFLANPGIIPEGVEEIGFDDFAHLPLITVDRSFKARRAFDDYCESAGIKPMIALATNDKTLTYNMVERGKGGTIIAEHELNMVQGIRFSAVPIRNVAWEYGLSFKKDRERSSAVGLFLSYVLDCYGADGRSCGCGH